LRGIVYLVIVSIFSGFVPRFAPGIFYSKPRRVKRWVPGFTQILLLKKNLEQSNH